MNLAAGTSDWRKNAATASRCMAGMGKWSLNPPLENVTPTSASAVVPSPASVVAPMLASEPNCE